MQIDRRTQFGLNAAIGLFVTFSLSGLGWLVISQKRAESPSVPSGSDGDFRDLMHRGYLAEQAADDSRAESCYRSAHRMRPERGDVKLILGRLLAHEGRKVEARQLFHEVIDQTWAKGFQPGGANDALSWYADLTMSAGDLAKGEELARSTFIRSKSVAPLTGPRLLAKAHLYGASATAQMRATTLAHLQRAVEIDPAWVLPHLALARFHMDLKQANVADAAYREARRLASLGTGSDWLMLARFDVDRCRNDLAEASLRKAEQLIAPTDTDAWLLLFFSARGLSQTDLASAALKKAARSLPSDDPEALLRLALIAPRDQAVELAGQALRSSKPNQAELNARIASLMGNLGEKKRAIAVLDRTIPLAKATQRPFLVRQRDQLLNPPPVGGAFAGFGGEYRGTSFPDNFGAWLNRELVTLGSR